MVSGEDAALGRKINILTSFCVQADGALFYLKLAIIDVTREKKVRFYIFAAMVIGFKNPPD